MSAWRRKAIEAFPDLRGEFQAPDTTIYQVFFELLPRVRAAHARGDKSELQRIYNFARWCFQQQQAEDLQNAAAVAFYEHLVDEPETMGAIPRWLQPDVFAGCKDLFAARLEPAQFRELDNRYADRGRLGCTG